MYINWKEKVYTLMTRRCHQVSYIVVSRTSMSKLASDSNAENVDMVVGACVNGGCESCEIKIGGVPSFSRKGTERKRKGAMPPRTS